MNNREINAVMLKDLKVAKGCAECGIKHPAVLDFHHRDQDFKNESISEMLRSGRPLVDILLETQKCDILCANCHRKFHYEADYAEKMGET